MTHCNTNFVSGVFHDYGNGILAMKCILVSAYCLSYTNTLEADVIRLTVAINCTLCLQYFERLHMNFFRYKKIFTHFLLSILNLYLVLLLIIFLKIFKIFNVKLIKFQASKIKYFFLQ